MRRILLLITVILIPLKAFTQQPVQQQGEVSGVVQDSVLDYVLPSATVAIYRAVDSALINFQLTVQSGEFRLKNLPLGIPIKLVVSYMGYRPYVQQFTLLPGKRHLDLGLVNMERSNNQLAEVVVSIPPVQMKGDTLEFNADAFKLDSSAVVEDLMRRLPSVTVWGDGAITVNGRPVQSVLVEGKPFFGADKQIALQNLPKIGVDKVQVYGRTMSEENKRDTTLEMNIKLKKGYKKGIFGKIGVGAGTNERFQADAMLSAYNARTQVSVLGNVNNVNISPSSTDAMMKNATFKSGGLQVYQPNFRLAGTNQPNIGGFRWLHDFYEETNQKKSRAQGNYIVKNDNGNIAGTRKSVSSFPDGNQTLNEERNQSTFSTKQQLDAKYEWKQKNNSFYVSGTGNVTTENNRISRDVFSESAANVIQSESHTQAVQNTLGSGAELQVGFNSIPSGSIKHLDKPRNWNVGYIYAIDRSTRSGRNRTDFSVFDGGNTIFNRDYRYQSNRASHKLSLETFDLSNLLVRTRFLRRTQTKFSNELNFFLNDNNRQVNDLDSNDKNPTGNKYLSYLATDKTLQETPAITFSRFFSRRLADRYSKTLTIDLTARGQFTYQNNRSSHEFLNITRRYNRFLPDASVRYVHDQYGVRRTTWALSYAETAVYPEIGDLVTVTDSTNQYLLKFGNIRLTDGRKQELIFRLTGFVRDGKNDFNYQIAVSGGKINDNISDSINTDRQGRRKLYNVNLNGYQYLQGKVALNKAFKYKENQLQISFDLGARIFDSPGYLNGTLNTSKNKSINGNIDLFYSYSDRLILKIGHNLSSFVARQQIPVGRILRNFNSETNGNLNVQITNRLNISSNASYNHAKLGGMKGVDFTIWNAGATYRLLKGKNLELFFNALDLLRRNTSVQNFGAGNTITQVRENILEQYFMIGINWFPRKFGPARK